MKFNHHGHDNRAIKSHIEYRCETCDFRTENHSNARTHSRQTGHPFAEWRF